MSPSKGSSVEIRTAYFLIAIPESVKTSLLLSAVILPLGRLILRLTLYYIPGIVTFGEASIEIVTRRRTKHLAYSDIRRFQVDAGKYVFFFPNISTLIVVVDKDAHKSQFLLRQYKESEDLASIVSLKGIDMLASPVL